MQPTPARGEKAPLLKPWKDASKPHRNSWTVFFGWLRHTLVAALLFMLTSGLFMVGYHQNPHFLIAVAVFFSFALLSDALFIYRLRGQLSKESFAFAVCAFAVFAGGLIGMSIHLTQLLDYWPYYQKRHYTNVAPDEPAAAHADASVIVFMEGARPDGTREVGYKRNGQLYCVAPISVEAGYSDDEAPNSDIQYWAIGVDCCGGHKGFTCDDAENKDARSGLVKQALTGEDTIGEGILSSDPMHFYEKAVKMSLTKFDLTSPKERLYVRFVKDVESARMGYWSSAMWSFWKYQLIWLLLWAISGVITVVLGAGDPQDLDGYNEHLIDAKQSALQKVNQLM